MRWHRLLSIGLKHPICHLRNYKLSCTGNKPLIRGVFLSPKVVRYLHQLVNSISIMNSSRLRLLSPLLLLGIPALAMTWTDEVNWSLLDFCLMGVLLLTLSFAIRLIRLRFPQHQKRVYIVVVILLFLLLWAELGVGVFGSPIAGD